MIALYLFYGYSLFGISDFFFSIYIIDIKLPFRNNISVKAKYISVKIF